VKLSTRISFYILK